MSTASDALVAGITTLAEAVRAVAVDPADQVRLLTELATYATVATGSAAPIGMTIAAVETETAAMAQRVALVSLARACAAYQPTSYNDAVELLTTVAAFMETMIVAAADGYHDTTYDALRALRTAVIQDLTARGASLPSLITVTTPQPVAALPLAYRLYGDATRSDDIIARGDPINPCFMPTSFLALAS
jgi:prophage DNA circulation protein